MFGFVNVNKPSGPSSHDIVYRVRRLAGRDVKVGHSGTLDPFAAGVLVVCLGGACRLASLVMNQDKRYVTEIALGATSTTDDRTGEICLVAVEAAPTRAQVEAAVRQFVGHIEQVPPSHSAIYVQGRRAYDIARKGEELTLPPRPVTIHSIDILEYSYPRLKIEVSCACGTYIRSIARDIGQALGTGGYCSELTRTASGDFTLATAVSPEALDLTRDVISPLTAVAHLPPVQLDAQQVGQLLLGRRVQLLPGLAQGEVAIVDPSGVLLGMGTVDSQLALLQPTKILIDTHKLFTRRAELD